MAGSLGCRSPTNEVCCSGTFYRSSEALLQAQLKNWRKHPLAQSLLTILDVWLLHGPLGVFHTLFGSAKKTAAPVCSNCAAAVAVWRTMTAPTMWCKHTYLGMGHASRVDPSSACVDICGQQGSSLDNVLVLGPIGQVAAVWENLVICIFIL